MRAAITAGALLTALMAAQGAARRAEAQQVTPRQQPGATITLYEPEQHDLYDGRFVLSASRVHMVGGLHDAAGWNHMDNAAASVRPVKGSVEIDVDEIRNTGKFEARLQIPEGALVLSIDRFHEFNPCQNGGVAAYIYEHGDSGCGDTNWPKTFVYVAGWGYGRASLDGQPFHSNYEMHFMVTQGMRDRATLKVNYPMLNKKSRAGEVNPAAQQLDFYIRSPQVNQANNPPRQVFAHFFAMEVTWK